jgi:hypothetical protein
MKKRKSAADLSIYQDGDTADTVRINTECKPEPRPLPVSILNLQPLQDTRHFLECSAAWNAASLLHDALNFWWLWTVDVRTHEDVDTDVPSMLCNVCYPAIDTLVTMRVGTKTFQTCDREVLFDQLPRIPTNSDRLLLLSPLEYRRSRFLDETEDRLISLKYLEQECLQLMGLLEHAPHFAIGERVQSSGEPPKKFKFYDEQKVVAVDGFPYPIKSHDLYDAYKLTINAGGQPIKWGKYLSNPVRSYNALDEELRKYVTFKKPKGYVFVGDAQPDE